MPYAASQGDACALPADLPAFDAVLAANLLCRLPDPMRFLGRCPSLVKRGGVLVLVSPFSWLEAWTPQQKWLGGYYDKVGWGWVGGGGGGVGYSGWQVGGWVGA